MLWFSWWLPAPSHWEVEAGGTRGIEEVRVQYVTAEWEPS